MVSRGLIVMRNMRLWEFRRERTVVGNGGLILMVSVELFEV